MPELNELTPLSCAELDEESSAYVWGALEPSERARVERHRAGCASCDQRLRASEQVIAQLDAGGPRLSPPPDLRRRVLGAVAALDARGEADRAVPPVRTLRPLDYRPRFLAGLTTGVAGTLAAAALLMLLIAGPATFSAFPATGAQFHEEPPAQVVPWLWARLRGGTTASTQRLIELRPTFGSASGLLMYDGQTRRGVLMLQDMTPQANYALWLAAGSQRVQVGILQTDADGFGTFVLPHPVALEQPERIEVTTADAPPTSILSGTF